MIRRLRSRLADESGFTLVVVMGSMLILTLLTVGALATVQGDLPLSHKDAARKQAYAAAEAGVADYLFHSSRTPTSGPTARACRPRPP